MSEKSKNRNIILKICLAVLFMIIAIAICLIVLSGRNDESSSESSQVSSDSSSSMSSFVQESSYEIELKAGETCKAELTDVETDSKPIWISSDNSIATVDDYGTITAVSEGTCTVTIVMMDSDENISVTVNVK